MLGFHDHAHLSFLQINMRGGTDMKLFLRLFTVSAVILSFSFPLFASSKMTTCSNTDGSMMLKDGAGVWTFKGVDAYYADDVTNYEDKDILAFNGSNDGLDNRWNLGQDGWDQPSYYIRFVKLFDKKHALVAQDYVFCRNVVRGTGHALLPNP